MNAETDGIELDRDAQEMLAAMREASALPPDLHDRVWARVEASVEHDTPSARPWRKIAGVAFAVAAAAIVLVSLDAREMQPEAGDRKASSQAPYGREADDTEGNAPRRGAAATNDATRAGSRAGDRSDPQPESPAVDPQPDTPAVDPQPDTPGLDPQPDASDPPARPRARSRTTDDAAHDPKPSGGSTLAEEIAVIEAIRGALLVDAPARALKHVREHARRFPHGMLVPEREALRAVAMCSAGEAGGPAKADAFVRAHPDSPLVAKVRSACSDEQTQKSSTP